MSRPFDVDAVRARAAGRARRRTPSRWRPCCRASPSASTTSTPASPGSRSPSGCSPPRRDAAAFARDPRPRPRRWSDAVRAAVELGGAAACCRWRALRRLRVRADEAHARLAAYLDVRPARTVEVQWLVRRAFCRGLGEPEVDGLHEPRRWSSSATARPCSRRWRPTSCAGATGYIEHHGRLLRVESELGVSWQAQLVVGALPERGVFPSAQLALLSAIPDGLPFAVDLVAQRALPAQRGRPCGWCGGASRTPTRSCAPRTTATRGSATRATSARRPRATCWATCSRPATRRCCARALAVAVAAAEPEELERRVAACRRAFGEIAPAPPARRAARALLPAPPRPALARPRLRRHPHGRAGRRDDADRRAPDRLGQRPVPRPHAERRALPGALRPARGLAQRPPHDGAGRRLAGLGQDDPHPGAALPRLSGRARGSSTPTPRAITASTSSTRSRRTSRRSRCAPSRALRGLLDPLRVAPEHLRHDAAVSFLSDLLPARADTGWLTAIVRAVDAVVRTSRAPTCGEVVRALDQGDAVDEQVARDARRLRALGAHAAGVRQPRPGAAARSATRQVTYIAAARPARPPARDAARRLLAGRARRRADRAPDRAVRHAPDGRRARAPEGLLLRRGLAAAAGPGRAAAAQPRCSGWGARSSPCRSSARSW